MKLKVVDSNSNEKGQVDLPVQFSEPLRQDLIQRAVLALQSRRRMSYGAKPDAGKRAVTEISRRRRDYKASYGKGISRVPRKVMAKSGAQFTWEGAFAPGTRGGRRAHPPKSYKQQEEHINKKENRKAILSAISATIVSDVVKARGHKVPQGYPFALDASVESIEKAKQAKDMLLKLNLKDELERCSVKKIRAGRGKLRNRKYVKKVGPLIVVSKPCKLEKACKNLPGVDVKNVHSINAEILAPGAHPGRLTLWTAEALSIMKEKKLFM
ncbi:50S ribosomal protein L4 [Candidatus Woesearchaeota archaeon]|nr:50S ribosomal protein L4 [Candidatus Woesearchaeota archaeon]